MRNVYLALCRLQFFTRIVSFDSHGNPNKYYYVHFAHGENETHFGHKQIRVNDLFDITENSRAGTSDYSCVLLNNRDTS